MENQTVMPPGLDAEYTQNFLSSYFTVNDQGRVITTQQLSQRVYVSLKLRGGLIYPGEVDPDTQWFDGEALAERPESTVYLEGNTLKNIKTPAFVYVNGERYACNDTEVELVFNYPGTVAVVVDCFPDKLARFEIENNG